MNAQWHVSFFVIMIDFATFEIKGYIKEVDLGGVGFIGNLPIIVSEDFVDVFFYPINHLWIFIEARLTTHYLYRGVVIVCIYRAKIIKTKSL